MRCRFSAVGLLIALCLQLSACADGGPLAAPGSEAAAAASGAILTPSMVLTSAPLYTPPGPTFGIPRLPVVPASASHAFLSFLAPSVVAVRNQSIYIGDSGHRRLFRYDVPFMGVTRFSDYVSSTISAAAVAPDMSLYVADVNVGRVLHFTPEGRLLQTFTSESAMARPVGIVLNEATGQVFVADNLYKHVIVFNSLGHAMGTLKSERIRNLDAMAAGPDGLYMVDRLGKEVVVMGFDGMDRYTLGGGELKDPLAIAVDRFNRVFVSDGFDNSIKIFEGDELLARYGGPGAGPAAFNRATSLCIDQDILYVADSLNRRVQTFRIALPGPGVLPNE